MNTVFGIHAVDSFLENNAKNALSLTLSTKLSQANKEHFSEIALKNGIKLKIEDSSKLDKISDGGNHQGVLLEVKDFVYANLSDTLDKINIETNPCLMILDEIEDPHNLGAIIRSSTALGVSAIIIPKDRCAHVNGTVYKTSGGTVGKIPIVSVINIRNTILELKKRRYWVVALDGGASQVLKNIDLKSPIAFIIGNEGRGVSMHVSKDSDFVAKIEMQNNVESLNASVTSALCAYEWRNQNN